MRFLILLAFAFAVALPSSGTAAEWGNLKMRFVYDGEPPQPKFIKTGTNSEIPDESLLVNERDRGIKNVCVWLLHRGDAPLVAHPDYEKSAADTVTMKIVAGSVVPRFGLLRTTQMLRFVNEDVVGYNPKIDFFANQPFNRLLPQFGSITTQFPSPEHTPVLVSCSIHPWTGYLFVRDNPYFALSDERGQLIIKNVPVGERTFVVWHEKLGYVRKVVRADVPTEWHRGRLAGEIKSGDNNLGEIRLTPEQFRK